jgi:poly(A) polymerase
MSSSHYFSEKIIDVLAHAAFETRYVGGCVRDALLGLDVRDIDLATTAKPSDVMGKLQGAGIKTVPTGLEHGTVTAVEGGEAIEITTLREDIRTDGRHAEVTFTTDWKKDAERRDFTLNALSRDRAGEVFDYVGGVADLKDGRLRFVGDASARIQEDYLRVLRFFRFQAYYGKMLPDEATLEACKAAAPKLSQLSRERVWKEISTLLAAPNPSDAWMLMMKHDIIPHIFPEAQNLQALCSLLSYENMRQGKNKNPNPLLRLAALLMDRNGEANALKTRFAMSSNEAEKLGLYLQNPLVFGDRFSTPNLSFALHRYGFDLTQDFLLLAQTKGAQFDWESARPVLDKWVPQIFPLKGQDVLALGVPAGPRIGAILREVEEWWVAQNFAPDQAACMEKAKSLIASA